VAKRAMLLLVPVLAAAMWGTPQRPHERTKMSPSQVVESVKRRNWDIVEEPGHIGQDAVPALLPLLNDPDSQVRELTVVCLDSAGGPAANQGLLKALDDHIETVSAAAVRALAHHYTAAELPILRIEMGTNPNEYVREQIALLLGKTGDPFNIPILHARRSPEKDEHTQRALSLALARLGDPAGRQEVVARLSGKDARQLVAAVRDLLYVNDRLLLRAAAPLLDDTRPGLNVGLAHTPTFIRVCDVVVIVMGEMLGPVFSFDPGRRRFSPEEIAEAKQVMARIQ